MAFYVLLWKEKEDDTSVVYCFSPDEKLFGRLWLDKSNGEIKEIEPVPINNSQAVFVRAAIKIRQHWKQGNFPEKTCWAS